MIFLIYTALFLPGKVLLYLYICLFDFNHKSNEVILDQTPQSKMPLSKIAIYEDEADLNVSQESIPEITSNKRNAGSKSSSNNEDKKVNIKIEKNP
jgi:hypothetical protein